MQLFLEGLFLGVPLMFLVGPVLLTLLQASLGYGARAGFAVAIGITVSDLVYLVLCYFVVRRIPLDALPQGTIRWCGGIFLVVFGIVSFFQHPTLNKEVPDLVFKTWLISAGKGFLVNFVNPFVLVFWLSTMSMATARHGFAPSDIALYFSGTVLVVFGSDTAKAFLANQLKRHLTDARLLWINRLAGTGLFLYGGYVLINPS